MTKLGDSTACLLSIDPPDYLCEIEEVPIAKVISVSEDNFRGVVKLADGRTVSFERDRLVDILDIEVNRPVTRFFIDDESVIAILSAFGNTSLIKLEDGRTLVAENSKLIEKWDDRLIDTVSLVENRNIHLDTITFYDPIRNQLRDALVQGKKIIVPLNENFQGCIYYDCLQKNNSDCISITGRLVLSPICFGYEAEKYVFFLDKNRLIVNRDYTYEPLP